MFRALVVAAAATFSFHALAQGAAAAASNNGEGVASAHAPRTWADFPQAGLSASPWGCRRAGCGGFSRYELWTALERQRRFDDLRQEPAAAPTGFPASPWLAPPAYYLPPPTPEKHIQPEYRERSVLRPEFRESGQPAQ